MGLETGVTYIDDLVATNPDGSVDTLDESDNHHRIIKTAVQGSFPNLGAAAVTKTAAQINTAQVQTIPATTNNLAMLDALGDLADSLVESDGAGNITANVTGDVTGNAGTATRWETTRTIECTGDVTAAAQNINGAGNVTLTTQIAADSVNFANEMNDANSAYDWTFSDTDTQIVDAGVFLFGENMPLSGAMDGDLNIEFSVSGAWYVFKTFAVSNGSASIDVFQLVSNGNNVRYSFTYTSGAKSSITFPAQRIFA